MEGKGWKKTFNNGMKKERDKRGIWTTDLEKMVF